MLAMAREAGGIESAARRPPSFFDGVGALLAGARFIARHRRTWAAAAVPLVIASLLAGVLIWWSIDRVGPWLSELVLPTSQGWLGRAAKSVVRWLGSALAAYVSIWIALAVTPIASAPALEHLVRLKEAALGLPARPVHGFWFELRCEIEAQLLALAVLAPFALLLWVLGVLAPALWPLLGPLHGVLVSLAVAWNLLGYPLILRGARARERLRLMRGNPLAVLGFGAAFALASLIPGAGLLLLPAGVVGATWLSERLLE